MNINWNKYVFTNRKIMETTCEMIIQLEISSIVWFLKKSRNRINYFDLLLIATTVYKKI